jgi:hypothetical protein
MNVYENCWPGRRFPLSQTSAVLVVVWIKLSRLVQRTVEPCGMVTFGGRKLKSIIRTSTSMGSPGTHVDVAVGVGVTHGLCEKASSMPGVTLGTLHEYWVLSPPAALCTPIVALLAPWSSAVKKMSKKLSPAGPVFSCRRTSKSARWAVLLK